MNEVLDSCVSTNDLVRELGRQGAPHGTWISARTQTGGRGRLGRAWESSVGNLHLSILVREVSPERRPWIPLAAARAIADCLLELEPSLPLTFKAPNDLLLDGGKCCGVLCESSEANGAGFVVVGIGLNCAVAPSLDQPTARLLDYLPSEIAGVDQLRARVLESVLKRLERLEKEGTSALKAAHSADG